MGTELELDGKGLDQSGRSTLTIPELLGHMTTAKKIALLDSAFHEVGAEPAQLAIRIDGTHVVLPGRGTFLDKTLPATATLIDAMVQFSTNPTDESASELKRAEDQFDPESLQCVQHAIYDACRSEEVGIQAHLGEKVIHFRLPHKAMLPTRNSLETNVTNDEEDKIENIFRYLDAIPSTGIATFIRWTKAMPNIKAGDRIALKLSKNAKHFLRLNDIPAAANNDR